VTLAEAVLGTAILGTMLVGIVVSAARLEARRGRAERRTEACRAADDLLERWWPNTGALPRNGSGPVPGREGWTWRTETVADETARELGGEVVALELLGPAGGQEEPMALRVELLLPEEPEGPDDEANAEAQGPDAG
jgi:hypothetical protein